MPHSLAVVKTHHGNPTVIRNALDECALDQFRRGQFLVAHGVEDLGAEWLRCDAKAN